jgi:peptidoglycan hydrolase-like protein with peptidoglycan-binding domain
MIRKLALVTAVLAGSLGANTLVAQTAAPAQKPAAAPAMKHQVDSTKSATKPTAKVAAKQPAAATMHHAAWTKDQIKEAQEGLTKAGLYKGKASGVMNADTRKALRQYQQKEKLPVTGRLSDSVLVKLKSA